MPQKRPEYFPGGVYHIYNRGAHQVSIVRETANFLFILRKMKRYSRQFNLTLIAYCLMYNHYHFLIRQDGAYPAGLLPQRVFNSYSKAYNKRYNHSGTLFEGPYKVKPVIDENYMLHLCRYMHANPVKDGLVAHSSDWPYSNYLEWVGLREGSLVDREFVNRHFPSAAAYAEFVAEYLRTRKLPPDVLAYLNEIES